MVEIYRHVGEKVRVDLSKKGIPSSRLAHGNFFPDHELKLRVHWLMIVQLISHAVVSGFLVKFIVWDLVFSLCITIFGFFFSILGFLFLFSIGSLTIVLASNSFLPLLLESVKFSFLL